MAKIFWREQLWQSSSRGWSHRFFDKRLFIFLSATNIFHDLQQLNSKQPTHKESELLLELQKTAEDKGFVICDNPASGNCMFYTLSEQLQHVKGINISHKEIRKELVRFLENFPNLVRPLHGRSLVLNFNKITEWFELTRKPRRHTDGNLLKRKEVHGLFRITSQNSCLLSFYFISMLTTNEHIRIHWLIASLSLLINLLIFSSKARWNRAVQVCPRISIMVWLPENNGPRRHLGWSRDPSYCSKLLQDSYSCDQ